MTSPPMPTQASPPVQMQHPPPPMTLFQPPMQRQPTGQLALHPRGMGGDVIVERIAIAIAMQHPRQFVSINTVTVQNLVPILSEARPPA